MSADDLRSFRSSFSCALSQCNPREHIKGAGSARTFGVQINNFNQEKKLDKSKGREERLVLNVLKWILFLKITFIRLLSTQYQCYQQRCHINKSLNTGRGSEVRLIFLDLKPKKKKNTFYKAPTSCTHRHSFSTFENYASHIWHTPLSWTSNLPGLLQRQLYEQDRSNEKKRWRCVCLSQTRKLEQSRIGILSRRHDVSHTSDVVEPYLHIAESLPYKPSPSSLRASRISLA